MASRIKEVAVKTVELILIEAEFLCRSSVYTTSMPCVTALQ